MKQSELIKIAESMIGKTYTHPTYIGATIKFTGDIDIYRTYLKVSCLLTDDINGEQHISDWVMYDFEINDYKLVYTNEDFMKDIEGLKWIK